MQYYNKSTIDLSFKKQLLPLLRVILDKHINENYEILNLETIEIVNNNYYITLEIAYYNISSKKIFIHFEINLNNLIVHKLNDINGSYDFLIDRPQMYYNNQDNTFIDYLYSGDTYGTNDFKNNILYINKNIEDFNNTIINSDFCNKNNQNIWDEYGINTNNIYNDCPIHNTSFNEKSIYQENIPGKITTRNDKNTFDWLEGSDFRYIIRTPNF